MAPMSSSLALALSHDVADQKGTLPTPTAKPSQLPTIGSTCLPLPAKVSLRAPHGRRPRHLRWSVEPSTTLENPANHTMAPK